MVLRITDEEAKKAIARRVLEALPEWFGIPKATEAYIQQSAQQAFFAIQKEADPIAFLCLKETGKATVELSVMAVLKPYHRQGLGKELVSAAKVYAANKGYSFMQVKTVEMGHYQSYDITNNFYLSQGFKEFEVFPTLWDEWNPCQIYVTHL